MNVLPTWGGIGGGGWQAESKVGVAGSCKEGRPGQYSWLDSEDRIQSRGKAYCWLEVPSTDMDRCSICSTLSAIQVF